MSLGVLNNLNAVYAQNNLNNTSNSLSKVLQQLSSGSKINSGADDAAGLSLVNGLQANAMALSQSKTNASEGVGLLTVADGALSQVTSLLNRAVTLATEASNGTLNTSQLTAANQEYQSILSEVSNIGSTTTYNQQQVFGKSVDIYTGDSTTSGASINSLNIRSLSSSNLGDTQGTMNYSNGATASNVFLDLSENGNLAQITDSLGASNKTNVVNIQTMTTNANGQLQNTTTAITIGSGTQYANTVQGLMSAINNSGLGVTASFGTAAQAGAQAVSAAQASQNGGGSAADTGIIITGAGLGTGTADAGEIGKLTVTANADTLGGTLNIVDSKGTSHAITLGAANTTDNISDLTNTINASGYGVTAIYNSTNHTMELLSTSTNASVNGTTLTDAGNAVSLSDQPTTKTANATTLGTITLSGANATVGDTLSGTLTIGSNAAITLGGAGTTDTLADLAKTINSSNYGVTATYDAAKEQVTFTSTNSSLTISQGTGANAIKDAGNATTAKTATFAAATSPTTSDYYSTKISIGTGTQTNATSIVDQNVAVNGGTPTNGGSTNVGLISDLSGTAGIATISYTDQAGQSLANTDLLNQTDAKATLTALNSAIADVAAQDGYIGAQINTLNAVSNVLGTQSENVQAAQNDVQATDYASATSNMSKYEILSQTGISALAQANSQAQEVTKLLQ